MPRSKFRNTFLNEELSDAETAGRSIIQPPYHHWLFKLNIQLEN